MAREPPKISVRFAGLCKKCVDVPIEGEYAELKDAHKYKPDWNKHGNLMHLLKMSGRDEMSEEVNYTFFYPPKNIKGKFTIEDHEKLCWLSMFRPQKCNSLNLMGPKDSCLIIDCEAETESEFLDPRLSYNGKPSLLTVLSDAVFDAVKKRSKIFITSACGISLEKKSKTSFHMYFTDFLMTHKQRRIVSEYVSEKIVETYGDNINSIPTKDLIDLKFTKQERQHTRAPYSDKRTILDNGEAIANNRPLVPFAWFSESLTEQLNDTCWLCFMKQINLFRKREPITLDTLFQVQQQERKARLLIMAQQFTDDLAVPDISETKHKRVVDGFAWDEEDNRREHLLKLLTPYVGETKLQKVYDRLSKTGKPQIKGYIAGRHAWCQFRVPKERHKQQRTVFYVSSGSLKITDKSCGAKNRIAEYDVTTPITDFLLSCEKRIAPPFAVADIDTTPPIVLTVPEGLKKQLDTVRTLAVLADEVLTDSRKTLILTFLTKSPQIMNQFARILKEKGASLTQKKQRKRPMEFVIDGSKRKNKVRWQNKPLTITPPTEESFAVHESGFAKMASNANFSLPLDC